MDDVSINNQSDITILQCIRRPGDLVGASFNGLNVCHTHSYNTFIGSKEIHRSSTICKPRLTLRILVIGPKQEAGTVPNHVSTGLDGLIQMTYHKNIMDQTF